MKLIIEPTENGYILTEKHTPAEEGNKHGRIVKEVIEEPHGVDENEVQAKTAESLLWSVLNRLGIYYSKHKRYNVAITIEPGSDKAESVQEPLDMSIEGESIDIEVEVND